jgi:hypothetical protein
MVGMPSGTGSMPETIAGKSNQLQLLMLLMFYSICFSLFDLRRLLHFLNRKVHSNSVNIIIFFVTLFNVCLYNLDRS